MEGLYSLGARPFSGYIVWEPDPSRENYAHAVVACARGAVGVVAGGAARCPSSETEMYGSNKLGIAQVSALRSFGSVRSSEIQMY